MNKKWQIVLIWLGGIAVVALIVMVGMKSSVERKITEELADEKKGERIDVEEYYSQNGDLIDKYSAEESDDVQSEKQALVDMENRGFNDYPVYSDYLISGEYTGMIEISETDEIHPSYQTSYITSEGDIWTIFLMNGAVIANPVSYNMQSGRNVQLILSESEKIMGYDSETNMFYEVKINESELIVKVVDRIDAQTLDKLSVEEIDDL